MAVLLELSAGQIVIDLFVDECPLAADNFLKLCKIKYYDGCLFYNVQSNFLAQTGDPTGTGSGGSTFEGIMKKNTKLSLRDEILKSRKFDKLGLVAMSSPSENSSRSQFFITLRGDDLNELDGKHTIIGEISEGIEILAKINELYCDEDGRPFQDFRIKETFVLDDPFPNPENLDSYVLVDSTVNGIPRQERVRRRIAYETDLKKVDAEEEAELEAKVRKNEAKARAIVLEMTGDIPDADIKPPSEVLFVCKLNQVTRDADLELIFSRFGKIKLCEVIRDPITGDSLNYAFIEFESEEACVRAYEKMNNVLIDDRRIKVDFSQSVSHLWNRFMQRPRDAPRTAPSTTRPQGKSLPPSSPPLPRSSSSPSSSPPLDVVRSAGKDSREERQRMKEGGKEQDPERRRDSQSERDRGREQERDRGREKEREKEKERDRVRSRSRERGRGRDERDRDSRKDRHHDRDGERGRERESREREKGRERERERGRYRDRSRDR